MPLRNPLFEIRPGFGGCGGSGLDNGVLDIATADGVALRQLLEIDVRSQRRLSRMNLQLPDPYALLRSGHIKQYMGSDATLECRVEVRRQIGRKDYDAVERLQGPMMRPLFWTSGIFFTANDLPSGVREFFVLNPVLHVIETVRDGWFTAYTARYVDRLYVVSWILGLFFLGLALERVARRRIQLT